MGIYDSTHRYDPDKNGRCQGGWFNNASDWINCGSRQRSSVLHDDPDADFREMHDHGGRDCMCFEGDVSWTDARNAYRQERIKDDPSLTAYYRKLEAMGL